MVTPGSMANPERGEVDLDVKGYRYRLVLSTGALCAIQRAVSTPARRVTLAEVANGAFAGDVEYLCAMVWGALQKYHPDVTETGVQQLIDDLGGIDAYPMLHGKINEMLTSTRPDARDAAALKKTAADASPAPATPAPIGSTGTASISKRERSA